MRYQIMIWLLVVLVSVGSVRAQSPVDTLIWNGPSENRVNLVVLGDGYRLDERNKFDRDAQMLSEYLMQSSPYREYANFFNVIQVWAASNESGAARDPSRLIDNFYGSTYNYAGIDRLLVPTRAQNASQVLRDNFPSYDMVMMLVNDSKYGGSGGWLATTSTHPSAPEIAVHEVGHSFANLADEYWAGPQFAREKPNMTQEIMPDRVKWKNWLGEKNIGIFPFQEDMSWHRPHENCKMRRLGPPFCAVCTEYTVETIHSLVDVIDEYSPGIVDIGISPDDTIHFSIDLVLPDPNTLRSTWTLNGDLVSMNVDSHLIEPYALEQGPNVLEYLVVDSTSLSRTEAWRYRLNQVKWNIDNRLSTKVTPEVSKWKYDIGPNPVQGELTINSSSDFNLRAFGPGGHLLDESTLRKGLNRIDCRDWGPFFVLHLDNGSIHRQHIIVQPN